MSPDPTSLFSALAERFPSQCPEPLLGRVDTGGFQIQLEAESQLEAWSDSKDVAVSNGFLNVVVDDKHGHLWQSIEDSTDWPAGRTEIIRMATEIEPSAWFRDRRDPRKKVELYQQEIVERKKIDSEFDEHTFDCSIERWQKQWEEKGEYAINPPFEWPDDWEELKRNEAQRMKEAENDPFVKVLRQARPKKRTFTVGFVPTEKPWEIPAFLGFGNWNDCPETFVHVAIFKEWFSTFGAEPFLMEGDTVMMHVKDPPITRDDAWRLACDQAVYAEFDQSGIYADRKYLAASLIETNSWYFWWD